MELNLQLFLITMQSLILSDVWYVILSDESHEIADSGLLHGYFLALGSRCYWHTSVEYKIEWEGRDFLIASENLGSN